MNCPKRRKNISTSLADAPVACFAGHDHMDNYSAEYHGIRLSYGLSCDHNIYVVPFRGGQFINIKNDGTFTVQRLIRHRGQSTVTIGKEK